MPRPSTRSRAAGAVAAGLFLLNRRLGVIAVVAALLMAFARVYVGAHYPGDVMAGLLFGALVTLAGFALTGRVVVWLVGTLVSTPLRVLLTRAGGHEPPRAFTSLP